MSGASELRFASGGVDCAAWLLPARTDALRGPAGTPCVVMAHGFGGTRDTALLPFAEAFADAGIAALVFDYRGFGASGGTPRQLVGARRQRADDRAAVAAARRIGGVDPRRIVLWGTSYSGGHVLAVAAGDPAIAAVIAMTPAVDGAAALLAILRREGPGALLRLTAAGLRDAAGALAGRPPRTIPVAGPPGATAVIADEVAATAYPAIGGPTWRNEACARSVLGVGTNRPIRWAGRIRCPLLVQVGDRDAVAPPAAAVRAAERTTGDAEVRRFPVDHFGVYAGPEHPAVVADQVRFLLARLAPRAAGRPDLAAVPA